MNFVNAIGREGLYVRYVHELVKNSKSVKDWLGAGLGLKLHADIYGWKVGDEHWVDAGRWGDLELPAHSEFARKQAIYYHVLGYLGKPISYIQRHF